MTPNLNIARGTTRTKDIDSVSRVICSVCFHFIRTHRADPRCKKKQILYHASTSSLMRRKRREYSLSGESHLITLARPHLPTSKKEKCMEAMWKQYQGPNLYLNLPVFLTFLSYFPKSPHESKFVIFCPPFGPHLSSSALDCRRSPRFDHTFPRIFTFVLKGPYSPYLSLQVVSYHHI